MFPNEALTDRDVKFSVEDGTLIRTVTAAGGKGYTHRCDLKTLEAVAHAVDEAGTEGVTLLTIVRKEQSKFTRANVAFEFLKERGLIDVRHRRSYPASKDVYLDAMTEFHALAANA